MIHILPATSLAHFETISRLAHEIWHEHYIKIISVEQIEYMLEKYNSVSHITERANNGALFFYMTYNDKPVGYLAMEKHLDYLYISKLYVMKESRGKGIAKTVIDFVVSMAQDKGKPMVKLHVNKYNYGAIGFYGNMGFVNTESVITDIGNGFIMDDYLMVKHLKLKGI
ncbi:GNAT family N-acetyltransferase [uncultured Algibacter sp.]|uniref:GNAT family N-acetyltransferase n=1 Tax=uncultured Algibacter sp. TaxID=298659 RepID=UPI002628A29F|nr:GNAT family N-acetyltransferase [uncultured Algibacter sp.]